MPAAQNAVIDRRKIVDYLLADDHPTGRTKAAFFRQFGFTRQDPEVLEAAIRVHACETGWVDDIELTEFGVKFVVEGELPSPDGRRPRVYAVWFVEWGARRPRLVTVYPVPRASPFHD